jgi:protein involved in polysaccharide export with SLBB domain
MRESIGPMALDRLLLTVCRHVFPAVLLVLLQLATLCVAVPALAEDSPGNPGAADPTGYVYKLGSGDKIQVTVYGEPDLSGSFDVDGSGYVRLPLIGQVKAAGLTLKEFETAAEAGFSKGILINPKVSIDVTNYRPFSILGEVQKPGEYPYENGMSALNAVALGGGFTYRAEQDYVYVRRKGAADEIKLPCNDKTFIYPGDTVRVDERIF